MLDIRLQVEVKDQNMDKHPLGMYHIDKIVTNMHMSKVGYFHQTTPVASYDLP